MITQALSVFAALCVSSATAMEVLDDSALSEQSGRAGVTLEVRLPNSTLAFSQIGVVDSNGIAGTHLGQAYSGQAALVMAMTTYSATQGVRLFDGSGNPTVAPVRVDIDAGALTSSSPLATQNIAVSLPSDLRRIHVNPFSLYLSPAAGDIFTTAPTFALPTGTLKAGVTPLVTIGANGLDITFTPEQVQFAVQLGNEIQGRMLTFKSGRLLRIGNDASGANPIQIWSNNATDSSLKLDLELAATDQVNGFSLAGFYTDVVTDGLVMGKAGQTDKLSLYVRNVTAGDVGAQNTNYFNNLPNASMGGVGLEGLRVTDLAIKVSGL